MQTACKIILVRPRDPKNIGAVARAMKNFGCNELAVVAPFAPTWNEAVSAVNAEDVLLNAQLFDSLAAASADCTFVVGTADRRRIAGKHRLYTPRDLVAELDGAHHRLALVFGSEKHGLTNDDLAHCHRTMSIPTAPDCPSMNLGQAVAVCCYELTRAETPLRTNPTTAQLATAGEVEMSLELLRAVLREAQFVGANNETVTINKLRQRLLRLGLTAKDVKLLCGVLRQIQWRFENK
ncbi:MAG TPA: TrmJ/YjtD family RNA methyltransferase [Blastocatellia bacterium]|nr:TrmJ/YjtD family RNA methyltransferase [Blastocatellia bacterium]